SAAGPLSRCVEVLPIFRSRFPPVSLSRSPGSNLVPLLTFTAGFPPRRREAPSGADTATAGPGSRAAFGIPGNALTALAGSRMSGVFLPDGFAGARPGEAAAQSPAARKRAGRALPMPEIDACDTG